MKKIEVKLHHTVVAPLLDYLRQIVQAIPGEEPPFMEHLDDLDPEMQEMWSRELRELSQTDGEKFLQLFDKEFIETGTISLDEENASPVLRACSAFRLKLRVHDLAAIPDEILEQGDCSYESMSNQEKRGYSAYLFLGALQEIILEHLNLLNGSD